MLLFSEHFHVPRIPLRAHGRPPVQDYRGRVQAALPEVFGREARHGQGGRPGPAGRQELDRYAMKDPWFSIPEHIPISKLCFAIYFR